MTGPQVPPSTPNFQFTDKRGRTASGLQATNLNDAMAQLRQSGYSLPRNNTQARAEVINAQQSMKNRSLKATIDADRLRNAKIAGNGQVRTASNMMQVAPKQRTPMGTLADKGIPFNFENAKELSEIRRWARLFYACHDLVPLLIDIYSKFPLIGLEFESKDKEIKEFYSTMFLDGLDYGNWLPNAFAREYFISGEVTALAHFNEQLGTWSSEEILNPDMLDVSRSMLVDRERVQLRVKEMVDNLRTGPGGVTDVQETESQRKERLWQYKILEQYYPEIMHAATKDDGLDLSDALVSRIANKVSSWDLRGTPPLLRSFRTLMSEESLNAAQDAISDRLYSPFILAKLGVPDLGDGGPWIPDQTDLDNVRDDINNALMADLRVVVGNFSLDIESVFGREAMPRFDSDYDRIDRKLMQAWGIGEELISGGNASTYAGTAINREFVTQQMVTFQNLAKNHITRRMEVIAEAQEHYDYEKKGAYRRPLYREIVEIDPITGEEHLVRVPKLLLADVKFQTLNLRDEATERAFLMDLKNAGVPISDRTMRGSVDVDFEQELELSSEETYQKLIAQAQTMAKVQAYCDKERKPYPPELVQHLSATLQLRQAMGQTTMLEDQAKAMAQQAAQASPAGQLGILPGTVGQPAAPAEGQTEGGPPVARDPSQPPPPFESGENAAPRPGPQMQLEANLATGIEVHGTNGHHVADAGKIKTPGVPVAAPPTAAPPISTPPKLPGPPVSKGVTEVPRNRQRPAESDEMRGTTARKRQRRKKGDAPVTRLTSGPSSWGRSHRATEDEVIAAVRRRQRIAEHQPMSSLETLLENPLFWEATEKRAFQAQILADLPEIIAVNGDYERMGKTLRTSARLLDEALDQYEYIFGCVVERPDS